MTNEEIREELLVQAMNRLKDEAQKVINGVMGDLYCEYLPHVVTDTDSNIGARVQGAIRNMLKGEYEQAGEEMVWVSDSYGYRHLINLGRYDGLAKPLCDFMGANIQNTRIKELENDVEILKQRIEDSYRRGY